VKIKPGRCKDNWAKSTQRYYGLSWCKEPCDNAIINFNNLASFIPHEDVAFINSLSRFLENEENCVHLFSRNIDVYIHNYTKIQTVEGELKIYKSMNEGSNYYLDKFSHFLFPKHLYI
jgi:hypothetical protein